MASLLVAVLLAGAILTSAAAPIGNNFVIAGPGARFPDVAYGTVDGKYLVVWPDGAGHISGRLVDASGRLAGNSSLISETNALYPAVAYNAASNEFLVTWDDAGARGGVIYGQRVSGNGSLAGANFPIGSHYGGIRSAVAWSPVSSCYLVVYWGPGPPIDIFGQRVSGGGQLLGPNFNISDDAPFSGYPAVAWGASNNQFLVTWDNDDGNIYGRRVDASTGTLLGSTIFVTTGGGKDRSCVVWDSVNNRWLVQFNNGSNPGFSYDQYGQLVNPDGSLNGGAFPIAHTAAFEGDTQFGGDVAFAPNAARFFSSFGTDTGMGAQESSLNGAPVGAQVVLGSGYYTSLNNAADPQRNRFLTAWEGFASGSWYVFGQLSAASINPVVSFTATAADSASVLLAWRNPADPHFTGTLVRMKTTGYPAGPEDGELVIDSLKGPGASDSLEVVNLSEQVTCYFAAFAHDAGPNYASAVRAAATPRAAVVTLASSGFDSGADDWSLESWRAGSLALGTIAWDPAGHIVSTGSGTSNNRDTCTREGSMLTRLVPTTGRQGIQVEYDVMARLAAPPGGSVSGSCPVLDGSDEDKLVVFYSVSGTNGPWSVAQVLNEGVELPTEWTRKLINLAGLPAVNNNPGFALRFQWQFNSAGDTGLVDNVSVLSEDVSGSGPALKLAPAVLERAIQAGQNHPGDLFRVSNSGEGLMHFTARASVPWLTLNPAQGSSSGPEQRMVAGYNTAALPVGDYEASIQIASTNAVNSPQSIRVKLHILSPMCFREPFSFYDGELPVTGAASWSGAVSNQLRVQNGILRIIGGGGTVSATHSVNCSGSGGLIGAQVKIRSAPGGGDFFWNIAFDDAAGNNLARWYGGSTVARGRVGGAITPDIVLSGEGAWDDLYLKLDTVANTSEFFFNGVFFGALSHGATPANAVAAIRIERLDRASALNDEIHFDNLAIGPIDTAPPRLNVSGDRQAVALSWPADRMGASLESVPAVAVSNHWSTVAAPTVVTNGRSTSVVSPTNPASFYRLRLRLE